MHKPYNIRKWPEHACSCTSSPVTSRVDTHMTGKEDTLRNQLNNTLNFNYTSRSKEIVVTFALPKNPCLINVHTVHLYALPLPLSSNNCSAGRYYLHSTKKYTANGDGKAFNNKKLCSESAEVQFSYIFHGCYYVKVATSSPALEVQSIQKYVASNITIEQMKLMNTSGYVSELRKGLDFYFEFSYETPKIICVVAYQNIKCKDLEKNYTRSISKCVTHLQNRDKNNTCEAHGNITQCTFVSPVPAGHYCVELIGFDARCTDTHSYKVWFQYTKDRGCVWRDDVSVDYYHPDESQEPKSYWIIPVVIAVAIFVCIASLRIVLIVRKNKKNTNVVIEHNCTSVLDVSDLKILLLYARDCQPFMDIMRKLREMFKESCKCKVVDCYDEEYQRAIFTYENDWLLNHLRQSPDTKVILVVTECAVAHQLAQLGARTAVEYKDPEPFDKLFPLALKLLKEDVDPGLYNRIKLVEFSGFEAESESPNLFLNPFTRYIIPSAIQELLCAIIGEERFDLCESDQIDLQSSLDKLLLYKESNPTYLENFISEDSNVDNL